MNAAVASEQFATMDSEEMGDRKRNKLAFLAKHPTCCFCGGATPATTEDHVPCRAIFDERKWPEGHNFPACENCNRITRRDENVLAFLSRVNSGKDGNHTTAQKAEIARFMESMHYNHRAAFEALKPSANYVRGFLKERNLTLLPGVFLHDVPVLRLGQPEFIQPMRNFGIKLFCALHYKHWERIVPPEATIAMVLMTNVQLQTGEVLTEEVFRVLNGRPKLVRSNSDLEDQFTYVYGRSTEQTTSAYACKFRESFVLLGIVTTTELPPAFDENPEFGRFKATPFKSAMPVT